MKLKLKINLVQTKTRLGYSTARWCSLHALLQYCVTLNNSSAAQMSNMLAISVLNVGIVQVNSTTVLKIKLNKCYKTFNEKNWLCPTLKSFMQVFARSVLLWVELSRVESLWLLLFSGNAFCVCVVVCKHTRHWQCTLTDGATLNEK